ncbi:MAG: hypothetical protein JW833_13505 [Prolixibacteraceae bacterium]|nr:hypothetical protein [Prolixibacteraceae bacterium]
MRLKNENKAETKKKVRKQKQGGLAMKTINNVQKTTLRTTAAIISFVLFSLTVSAQGFWEDLVTNNSFGEIAEAMVNTTEKSEGLKFGNIVYSEIWVTNVLKVDSERNFHLENWMFKADKSKATTSEKDQNNAIDNSSEATFKYVEEIDEKLRLEDWMMK